MKYIKLYEQFNCNKLDRNESIDEGIKDWIIGGLIALSTVGSTFGQNDDGLDVVKSPTTKTEYQIHKEQLDLKVINGTLKYTNKILSQSNKLKFKKEGKYTIITGEGFSASFKQGTVYSKYNCFIGFGDENKPDAQISITLKDNGIISIIFGEERVKEDYIVHDFSGDRVVKKGTQLMSQTEVRKGDKGYDQFIKVLDLFNQN
jgi:hypothetical protein